MTASDPKEESLISRRTMLRFAGATGLMAGIGTLLPGCGKCRKSESERLCTVEGDTTSGPFSNVVLLRSLSGLTPDKPVYAADANLSKAILQWSRRILLVGKKRDLCLANNSVMQIASLGRNKYSFVAPISDVKTLRGILDEISDPALEASIGIALRDIDLFGGVLYLHRRLNYSGNNTANGRTRCDVSDAYWVDVYAKVSHDSKLVAVPLVRLHASFAEPYSYLGGDAAKKAEDVERWRATASFQEPDEVVLTWHELAQALGVERSMVYLRACLRAGVVGRTIFGYTDASGGPPPLTVFDDPSDNDVPPRKRVATSAYPLSPFYVPGREAPYTATQLSQDAFSFPPNDYSSLAALWQVDFEWVRINESPVPVPANVAKENAVPPSEGWYLSETVHPVTGVPKPEVPSDDTFGLAVVKFLAMSARGSAVHVGNGYFRVKAPDLVKLAAGTGNWGSPETIGVLLIIDGAAAPAAGVVGVGILVGVEFMEFVYQDRIEAELKRCYEKKGQDCEECVRGSLGYFLASAQTTGGVLSTGSAIVLGAGVCVVGVGVGCVVALLGAVLASWAIAHAFLKQDRMLSNCPSEFGPGYTG